MEGAIVHRKGPELVRRKALVEQETSDLVSDYKRTEETYGTEVLGLTVYCRYLERLLDNAQIEKYLTKYHPDVITELQQVVVDVKCDKEKGFSALAKKPA